MCTGDLHYFGSIGSRVGRRELGVWSENAIGFVHYSFIDDTGVMAMIMMDICDCHTSSVDMECWYVMVEYSLVVASIFSFRTMGQWGHWDSYTVATFCFSCNIVSAVG